MLAWTAFGSLQSEDVPTLCVPQSDYDEDPEPYQYRQVDPQVPSPEQWREIKAFLLKHGQQGMAEMYEAMLHKHLFADVRLCCCPAA